MPRAKLKMICGPTALFWIDSICSFCSHEKIRRHYDDEFLTEEALTLEAFTDDVND